MGPITDGSLENDFYDCKFMGWKVPRSLEETIIDQVSLKLEGIL